MPIMRMFIQINAEIDEVEAKLGDIEQYGKFLAHDIEKSLDNGEDYIEVKYMGGEIV